MKKIISTITLLSALTSVTICYANTTVIHTNDHVASTVVVAPKPVIVRSGPAVVIAPKPVVVEHKPVVVIAHTPVIETTKTTVVVH